MKGITFNLLEEIVQQEYGEDAWDQLIESAQLDGVYTSLGSYPDPRLLQSPLTPGPENGSGPIRTATVKEPPRVAAPLRSRF